MATSASALQQAQPISNQNRRRPTEVEDTAPLGDPPPVMAMLSRQKDTSCPAWFWKLSWSMELAGTGHWKLDRGTLQQQPQTVCPPANCCTYRAACQDRTQGKDGMGGGLPCVSRAEHTCRHARGRDATK